MILLNKKMDKVEGWNYTNMLFSPQFSRHTPCIDSGKPAPMHTQVVFQSTVHFYKACYSLLPVHGVLAAGTSSRQNCSIQNSQQPHQRTHHFLRVLTDTSQNYC